MIPNGLVSSFIRPFIGFWRDWKIIKLLSLEVRLCTVNHIWQPAKGLYFYEDLVYLTVYRTNGP